MSDFTEYDPDAEARAYGVDEYNVANVATAKPAPAPAPPPAPVPEVVPATAVPASAHRVPDVARVLATYAPTTYAPPAPPAAPPALPPPALPPPPRRAPSGGMAGATSSGGIGVLGVVLLGLIGYGAYLAYEDNKKAQALLGTPEETPHKKLARAARALARAR